MARFRLKSAKIWVFLLLFAVFYKLREFMGVDEDVSFSDQLNDLSTTALDIAIGLLIVAVIFFILKLIFFPSSDSSENDDD